VIASSGGPFAAPTTLTLTWEWDFTSAGAARCHVEATLATETTQTSMPLARSAQVVWRGEANAPGRTVAGADLPGLGRLTLTCEPGTDGKRLLIVDGADGAQITTREGSDDPLVDRATGPITTTLPNNGQVAIRFPGGQTLLASSRFKTNDPGPAQNSCAVAAQVLVP
jgi:hypothetical protein